MGMRHAGMAVGFALVLLAGCSASDGEQTGSGSPAEQVSSATTAATAVVPDLIGVPADSVVPTLDAAGFWLGTTTYRPSDLTGNTVIEQSPAPGTTVPVGTSRSYVTVVLSSGGVSGEPSFTAPDPPVLRLPPGE